MTDISQIRPGDFANEADAPGRYEVPHYLGEQYVRDYRRGWRDSQRIARGAQETAFQRGEGSVAYEDGYLDHAAERKKWHLAHCDVHENSSEGCGWA